MDNRISSQHAVRSARYRLKAMLTLAAAAIVAGGCGGGSDTATPDISTKELEQERNAPQESTSMDGFMISASADGVVIKTAEGKEERFAVREADIERIGLGHLASHAGITSIGFRVAYEEQDGERYILGATEIPPPGSAQLKSGTDSTGPVSDVASNRVVVTTSEGDRTFTIRSKDLQQVDPNHLREHMQSGAPIKVYYESEGDTDYVVRYDDA